MVTDYDKQCMHCEKFLHVYQTFNYGNHNNYN
jgi:hypothetical protein